MHVHISQADIIYFIIAIVGLIWQRYEPALPAIAREFVKHVGGEKPIKDILEDAIVFGGKSDEVKHAFAKSELQTLCLEETAIPMPDSIANIIVEWFFLRFKGGAQTTVEVIIEWLLSRFKGRAKDAGENIPPIR